MADLDQLKHNVEVAQKAAEEATTRRDQAIDEYDTARVEAMDPKVVQEAQDLGINPRNFETEDELQARIDITKREQGEEQ